MKHTGSGIAEGAYQIAVGRLRELLASVKRDSGGQPSLAQVQVTPPAGMPSVEEIVSSRDIVIARCQPLFAKARIDALTKEDFEGFLDIKNNRHWSSLQRHPEVTKDMGALRRGLHGLLDEGRPVAGRFSEAHQAVPGMGPAIATAILTIAHPDKYGVWNGTTEKALKALGVWPAFSRGASLGDKYERVNAVLTRLAQDLPADLWTLDALWWKLVEERKGVPKTNWWDGKPEERYWCEITDRQDLGADLHCPTVDDSGKPYWSYSLIRAVWPGDIVFHYSTPKKAFVGASVAGGPCEERPTDWMPHGTVGRTKKHHLRPSRPGWWLPLYQFKSAPHPLTLEMLKQPSELAWIYAWLKAQEDASGAVHGPFQRYGGDDLRGAQGYLTKMPADFVSRWAALSGLAEALSDIQEELSALGATLPPPGVANSQFGAGAFNPKNDADYVAILKGGVQVRSRKHETLVRQLGELLRAQGAQVSTPHPRDLFIDAPLKLIVEAKTVGKLPPQMAIREAIGQLLEYRHFLGPREAEVCIALDAAPGAPLVSFVEEVLHIGILWLAGGVLDAGPRTRTLLHGHGLMRR